MSTIYETLKQDHDSYREVLAKLDATSGDSDERRKLFAIMKKELEAHTAAEEQTFYATLMAAPEGHERARHSVTEHKEAVDLVEELGGTDFSSAGWLTRFRKLKQELEHHMDEEEDELFARARRIIPDDQAEELGSAFDRRKRAEM